MRRKKLVDEINDKLRETPNFETVLQGIKPRQNCSISFVNPFSYEQLQGKTALLRDVDYLYADGWLLVTLYNLFNNQKIKRTSFDFSSIASLVFEFASDRKLKMGLIGATQSEIDLAVKFLLEQYPNLNICFKRNGYFVGQKDVDTCIVEIESRQIDILLIGMGTPFQEEMLRKVRRANNNLMLAITCGGFITQTAVRGDYYVSSIKRYGGRWIQRAIMHKHVRKRLVRIYPLFVCKYIARQVIRNTMRINSFIK